MAERERLLMGQFFKSILDRTRYVEILQQETSRSRRTASRTFRNS